METSLRSTASLARSAKAPQAREAGSQPAVSNPAFEELLRRAKAGDDQAFAALVSEARPRALAVALKVLRNPDDAEDAVQDAFLKVWRYLARFEGRASFSTWIHRIVMNASLDLVRRQSCRPEAHVESEESNDRRQVEPAHEETPEHSLAEAQTSAIVRTALASLSPSHRQALTLREFEDRSYEEIAAASKIPIGTVMSRLHHARRRLADELREVEPTLRAA
ncbi:MAG TPA: sigma-70 family RNA polymerase sigma factor [Polyangia bacterium]|nr:sigma-70 family RNA polymerase sigma factor [Polyangia bacterium]